MDSLSFEKIGEDRGMPGWTYLFIVEGELGEHLKPAFAPMTVTNEAGHAVMTGHIRDQSELQGVLWRIGNLGLTLVSAARIDENAERKAAPVSDPQERSVPSR
jgi:hypothetical protein